MTMNADIQRHPIRGAFWGLLFGIGLYFLAIGRKFVAFGSWAPLIVLVLAGVAINVVWSMFGPAKRAKAPAPSGTGPLATMAIPLEPPSVPSPPVTLPELPTLPPEPGPPT